jgi:hypothetical protein
MGEYKPITNAEQADIESGTGTNIVESKKSSRPAQLRLASLDVFRGITVAVCSYISIFTSVCFHFSNWVLCFANDSLAFLFLSLQIWDL